MAALQSVRPLSVEALFEDAGLKVDGTVPWGEPVPTKASGVYVIVAPAEAQPIVYIGRAVQLRRRIRQFYRHVHGKSSPHKGGQAILLLSGAKQVYWAEASEYAYAEHRLLSVFEAAVGKKPFGNRVRAAQPKA